MEYLSLLWYKGKETKIKNKINEKKNPLLIIHPFFYFLFLMYIPNFSLSNLFQTNPSTDFVLWQWTVGIGLGLLVVSGIFSLLRKTWSPVIKKMTKGYAKTLRWIGFSMLILTGLRLQGIPYFSMRIWWIVLFIVILLYIIREIRHWSRDYSTRVEQKEKKTIEKKYVPGKKKGRK